MFKKLVPVISLLLLAGPVLAADPAPSDNSSTPAKTASHKKHHGHKKTKSSTGTDQSAPKQ
jgi:hypothetical protein